MISVGILAAVFLFLLGSLQQHYSTTFLPITWAPGVRIQPSKDHFEALFQRNAFLQSSTLVDSFQPAGRADWPPDPWHLLGHFGSFPPPTHATLPQNFSQSLDNSWKGGSHVLVPRSQASLTFCPHDRVVCHRFSNTSHGLVDLGTVGAFPHACLDLALDFCGQPLAWLECWDNISHARECNHTVWGGTHCCGKAWSLGFGLHFRLPQHCGHLRCLSRNRGSVALITGAAAVPRPWPVGERDSGARSHGELAPKGSLPLARHLGGERGLFLQHSSPPDP
jgi:hypothetical protein